MKSRRLTAIAALALLGAGVFVLVLTGTRAFPRWLIAASLLVGALIVGWNALRRRGAARALFATVAIVLLVTFVGVLVAGGVLLEAIVAAALFSSAAAAARQAFRIHVPLPRAVAPTRPVVVWNPKSGGGKALAANLDAEARARGIEPIELKPGDDLLQLVRDAVADGADALAAAGGDGTQALVATIAAEVNGRVFVNNVSLGLYAEAVQRSGYRNAKIRTVLDTIPDFSDATGDGHVLEYTGPGGVSGRRATVMMVSNNQYRLGNIVGSGTRPSIDDGQLGVAVAELTSTDARGRARFRQWQAPTFEVGSDGPVPAGVDGEALVLDPPLRFSIRPEALRVRIAPQHPGASPSAAAPNGLVDGARGLLHIARTG